MPFLFRTHTPACADLPRAKKFPSCTTLPPREHMHFNSRFFSALHYSVTLVVSAVFCYVPTAVDRAIHVAHLFMHIITASGGRRVRLPSSVTDDPWPPHFVYGVRRRSSKTGETIFAFIFLCPLVEDTVVLTILFQTHIICCCTICPLHAGARRRQWRR